MCGRFNLRTPNRELLKIFHAEPAQGLLDFEPRYNIAPMTPIAVVRAKQDEPGRELTALKWGLVPFWSDDPKFVSRCINARADGIDKKASFREPLKKRRCIVPADGFYEWRVMPGTKTKQPYVISLKSGQPIAFAGLWERNTKVGAPLETATIITTDPNALLSKVHDRMPVILSPEAADLWLDPKVEDPRRLLRLLAPYDPDEMQAVPVSSYVGKVGNEGPVCIEPLADPEGELAL